MLLLTIRHRTTYRYRQPVAFGEHRMMLRPRESPAQRVVEARLAISPEPKSLHYIADGFGNQIGIARFAGRARELSFESLVCVEQSPDLHVNGQDDALPDCYRRADPDDPAGEVGAWSWSLAPDGSDAWPRLCAVNEAIHRGFAYRRREAQGTQAAAETLQLGSGTCRDFAVLMIAAARALGYAARFASGYLAVAPEHPDAAEAHLSTHAWAQVHLPRLGWIDFDPTSGSVGRRGLILVAVVAEPEDATPLSGTFLGFPADHLGMEVAVTITAGGLPDR